MAEWKKLPNRENYSVSDQGDVRNDNTGRILKQSPNQHGYARVSLSNGLGKTPDILFPHRAVAMLFIPNPEGLPQVNHINSDRADPRKENLEWVTPKQNTRHAIANGRWNPSEACKKANAASLLVNSKPVTAISPDSTESYFSSISELARYLNFGYTTVNKAVNNNLELNGYTFRT